MSAQDILSRQVALINMGAFSVRDGTVVVESKTNLLSLASQELTIALLYVLGSHKNKSS